MGVTDLLSRTERGEGRGRNMGETLPQTEVEMENGRGHTDSRRTSTPQRKIERTSLWTAVRLSCLGHPPSRTERVCDEQVISY